jgi:hypothetical protein
MTALEGVQDGQEVSLESETMLYELKGLSLRRLEAKIGLEVLSDLSNETLEGELSDEEFGRLYARTLIRASKHSF